MSSNDFFEENTQEFALEFETLQTLQGPEGKSAYEVALGNGFEGTEEDWLESLTGDKGDPFTYEDFTEDQLADLKGEKGDPFTYDDFTDEQLEALKGPKGDPGNVSNLGIINPDNFSGTDSQKLQAAFDAFYDPEKDVSSGGVISINRTYTLTSDIHINHGSSSNNNLIVVKGDGQVPRIDFGTFCFKGVTGNHDGAHGGVIFKDMRLTGESIGFDCSSLIRLTFDNCMIRRFTNFIYSSDYVQSVYFMGCYIRASLGATVKSVQAMDLKIIGCVCEASVRLLDVSQQMDGSSITDSCIEGYTSTPIILPANNRAVNISNNYFEENMGTSIDATRATENAGISICNNLFCEWRNGYDVVGIILLPASISSGNMIVMGNHHVRPQGILLRVPDGAGDLSRVFAFGNNGTTNNTNKIKMLTPDDLNNVDVDVDLELGVDYWTDEDRAQAVNEVVALASGGESWVFTMMDGSTMERIVPVGGASAAYATEPWTFVLKDGTSIVKEVVIV